MKVRVYTPCGAYKASADHNADITLAIDALGQKRFCKETAHDIAETIKKTGPLSTPSRARYRALRRALVLTEVAAIVSRRLGVA